MNAIGEEQSNSQESMLSVIFNCFHSFLRLEQSLNTLKLLS